MLKLTDISKVFNAGMIDEKVLFDGFSLTVRDGEFVSVVGSNGSGKTTMLNLVSGDIRPDGGSIELNGRDITKIKSFVRAKSIARVFQNPAMGTCPSMTIFENMSIADNKGKRYGLGRGLNTKRKDFYCDRLKTLGMGLEDRLNTLTGTLSGGQRQALALIMATMSAPDILLLDEHTAALDPKSADIVMELTDNIVRESGITALMVTHNLRYAVSFGNRAVMMHEGKVIMDIAGEQKAAQSIDDYLSLFNEISIECGN